MAGGNLFYGSGGGASRFNDVSVQSPCDSIFVSSSFLGRRSMLSFQGDNGDEELDEYFGQPEKKRRLTAEQIQFLEKSFEAENKLEPERKIELAMELGLPPRQIAIWFQNRRARWKTKQLEKDYEALLSSYDTLKADYDNLVKEKGKLKDEIAGITEKLVAKEKGSGNMKSSSSDYVFEAQRNEPRADLVCEDEGSKVSTDALKQEELSSAKSDVFDSDRPRYADGVHSSLLEPGDSSYVFEPDHSDLSQDEEDSISKNLLRPQYLFTKMVDSCYSGPPSLNFLGFPSEDHAFNFW